MRSDVLKVDTSKVLPYRRLLSTQEDIGLVAILMVSEGVLRVDRHFARYIAALVSVHIELIVKIMEILRHGYL